MQALELVKPETLQPTSDPEVTQAIEAFAAAKGNIHLAAERLHMPETLVYSLISRDPVLLAEHLRILTLINVFEASARAQTNLISTMPDMEPADQAKFYTNLLGMIATLTTAQKQGPNNQFNIQFNQMLRQIPDDAREAIEFLMNMGSKPEVVENDSD